MKLFKVEIRGGHNPTSTDYNTSYVVAEDSAKAYKAFRDFLDKEDLCFSHERELESVTLLAETGQYPGCRTLLFLPQR